VNKNIATDMNETYKLEKNYWTETDFDVMGWHDSKIHGLSFDSNSQSFKSDLLFDIDYIFEWVNTNPINKYFTFWIAPCTLVFHDVHNLKMNLDSEDYLSTEVEINVLRIISKQSNSKIQLYQAELVTNFGEIAFICSGYEQFVRKPPIHTTEQWLEINQRGGISYDKTMC